MDRDFGPTISSMNRLAALCLALSLAAAGCISIDQTITLQKDLTGTAAMTMTADLEPMVMMVAKMQHEMTGGKGEPPAAVIEKARQELLAAKAADPVDIEDEKEGLRESLPQGIKLIEASFKDDGLKLIGRFVLGFDKLSKLTDISLDGPAGEAPHAPIENPMQRPFEGLKIVEEGGTILITSPTHNPLADQAKPGEPLDPMAKSMVDSMMKGFRVAFRLNAPFEVIEHNAHRKEGTTLVWEYDAATIEKLIGGGDAPAIRVKYKK
jgi:hypothetical protein